MDKKSHTCCFTGHRNMSLMKCNTIKERVYNIIKELIEKDVVYFYNGGAIRFDLLAASIVLEMKKEYPQIKLILVLPYENHTEKWTNSDDIALYENTKKQADEVVCLAEKYYRGCMKARNRYLVDNSSYCICYKNYERSGTGQTVRYAEEKGLIIYNVAY